MSVNYTLPELEEALMEHPHGLTLDELYKVEKYYVDFWTDNLHSPELQPLDELVEEFLLWLAESETPYGNAKLFLQE
jgi:hypothetical protein